MARWQRCLRSGIPMAEHARREGFDVDGAYRWRHILRRTGRWVDVDGAAALGKAVTIKKPRSAVHFARVAVNDAQPACASMVLRLVLMNGRRAELEIVGVPQLGEVIEILERAA
jgi:hypothetical protein